MDMEDGSKLTAEKLRKSLAEYGILVIPENSSRYVSQLARIGFNCFQTLKWNIVELTINVECWFQDQNGYTPPDNSKWCALHIVLLTSKNIYSYFSQLPPTLSNPAG